LHLFDDVGLDRRRDRLDDAAREAARDEPNDEDVKTQDDREDGHAPGGILRVVSYGSRHGSLYNAAVPQAGAAAKTTRKIPREISLVTACCYGFCAITRRTPRRKP